MLEVLTAETVDAVSLSAEAAVLEPHPVRSMVSMLTTMRREKTLKIFSFNIGFPPLIVAEMSSYGSEYIRGTLSQLKNRGGKLVQPENNQYNGATKKKGTDP